MFPFGEENPKGQTMVPLIASYLYLIFLRKTRPVTFWKKTCYKGSTEKCVVKSLLIRKSPHQIGCRVLLLCKGEDSMSEGHFLNNALENVFTSADIFLTNQSPTSTCCVSAALFYLRLDSCRFSVWQQYFCNSLYFLYCFYFIKIHNKIFIR